MNEVEKMYRNAHVYPRVYGDITKETFENKVFNMADMCNEAFTAEKQIEIVKVIATNHISEDYEYKYLGIDRDEIDREIYLNLCIDGKKYHAHDKDFTVALAKLVNIIWQDLTEEERTQIKEILE